MADNKTNAPIPPAPPPPPPAVKKVQSVQPVPDIYKDIPVAFHFEVNIEDIGIISFKEASGLNSEMELESVFEGGVNDSEYKLPKRVKHSNLVLKRAMVLSHNKIFVWLKETLNSNFSQPIVPKDIVVSLLNQDRKPIYTWTCVRAYPVKWDVEPLDAEKNSVLIESVEFTYLRLSRWPKQ